MDTGDPTLHLPPVFSLISRQKQPWPNPTNPRQPREPSRGRSGAAPRQGPAPALLILLWVPPSERPAPGHLPGRGRRRGHRSSPFSQNPGGTPSISRLPGTALLPGCSSSPLHSHRDAGQVSMPRAGMSHAPPGHAASILCKPLAPFKQALKLRLISPVSLRPRSMENALSGDSASPRATTSHQAKPSMQQSPVRGSLPLDALGEEAAGAASGSSRASHRCSGSGSIPGAISPPRSPGRTNGLWRLG